MKLFKSKWKYYNANLRFNKKTKIYQENCGWGSNISEEEFFVRLAESLQGEENIKKDIHKRYLKAMKYLKNKKNNQIKQRR